MSDYISVMDAVNESGKSLSSVRRAIKELPPESVKKEGMKHLYSREALFKSLGLNIQPEPPQNVHVEVQEPPLNAQLEPPSNVHDELVEVLKEQVREQRETIAQLLERLRESNVISNNYQQRLLAIQEAKPEPAPMPADEKKKEPAWVAWLLLAILVTMLGLATYFSLPG